MMDSSLGTNYILPILLSDFVQCHLLLLDISYCLTLLVIYSHLLSADYLLTDFFSVTYSA